MKRLASNENLGNWNLLFKLIWIPNNFFFIVTSITKEINPESSRSYLKQNMNQQPQRWDNKDSLNLILIRTRTRHSKKNTRIQKDKKCNFHLPLFPNHPLWCSLWLSALTSRTRSMLHAARTQRSQIDEGNWGICDPHTMTHNSLLLRQRLCWCWCREERRSA